MKIVHHLVGHVPVNRLAVGMLLIVALASRSASSMVKAESAACAILGIPRCPDRLLLAGALRPVVGRCPLRRRRRTLAVTALQEDGIRLLRVIWIVELALIAGSIAAAGTTAATSPTVSSVIAIIGVRITIIPLPWWRGTPTSRRRRRPRPGIRGARPKQPLAHLLVLALLLLAVTQRLRLALLGGHLGRLVTCFRRIIMIVVGQTVVRERKARETRRCGGGRLTAGSHDRGGLSRDDLRPAAENFDGGLELGFQGDVGFGGFEEVKGLGGFSVGVLVSEGSPGVSRLGVIYIVRFSP